MGYVRQRGWRRAGWAVGLALAGAWPQAARAMEATTPAAMENVEVLRVGAGRTIWNAVQVGLLVRAPEPAWSLADSRIDRWIGEDGTDFARQVDPERNLLFLMVDTPWMRSLPDRVGSTGAEATRSFPVSFTLRERNPDLAHRLIPALRVRELAGRVRLCRTPPVRTKLDASRVGPLPDWTRRFDDAGEADHLFRQRVPEGRTPDADPDEPATPLFLEKEGRIFGLLRESDLPPGRLLHLAFNRSSMEDSTWPLLVFGDDLRRRDGWVYFHVRWMHLGGSRVPPLSVTAVTSKDDDLFEVPFVLRNVDLLAAAAGHPAGFVPRDPQKPPTRKNAEGWSLESILVQADLRTQNNVSWNASDTPKDGLQPPFRFPERLSRTVNIRLEGPTLPAFMSLVEFKALRGDFRRGGHPFRAWTEPEKANNWGASPGDGKRPGEVSGTFRADDFSGHFDEMAFELSLNVAKPLRHDFGKIALRTGLDMESYRQKPAADAVETPKYLRRLSEEELKQGHWKEQGFKAMWELIWFARETGVAANTTVFFTTPDGTTVKPATCSWGSGDAGNGWTRRTTAWGEARVVQPAGDGGAFDLARWPDGTEFAVTLEETDPKGEILALPIVFTDFDVAASVLGVRHPDTPPGRLGAEVEVF